MSEEDWFLTSAEWGDPPHSVDSQTVGQPATWTEGNRVDVLVDGAKYFRRLLETLSTLGAGDTVDFTDWEGDADERLTGPGTEIGDLLADLAGRGVRVRGLLWRSHPSLAHFAEKENRAFAREINSVGGEVVLDERVRRGGSHHQKLVVIRHSRQQANDVAFVGGIDLSHGRHDDRGHGGDRQSAELDDPYGERPPWHDVQLEVHGPAVGELQHAFRQRWQDQTPLDHRNPVRRFLRTLAREPQRVGPTAESAPPAPARCGPHAVQVLRTYPAKRPPYPFAPKGERTIARSYLKAFERARRLVYLEDQYLWSERAAHALAAALATSPQLQVVAVVPRYPDRGGRVAGAASRIGRERVVEILRAAGGDRVALFDLENGGGTPIYVHAKICIVDDVWMITGSDNLNRRSWTHDSELSCAIIDESADPREPSDPAGLGDGARRLPRQTRLDLWCEHLGREPHDDDDLVDPSKGIDALRGAAAALDAWHLGPLDAPRPPGHLRVHRPDRVSRLERPPAELMYRLLLDPDGRPAKLKRLNAI